MMRNASGGSYENIQSLTKLLLRYFNWTCISRCENSNKTGVLTILYVYRHGEVAGEQLHSGCDLTAFPSSAVMDMDFDAQQFICLLPIMTRTKLWGVVAASGLLGRDATNHYAEIMHYVELLAPAFERAALDEELVAYQEGLADLVKQKTAELMVAKEKAEAASHAKSAFLASMSHELRTPLNAILGYAQILKRDKNLDGRHVNSARTIEHSGEHLLALINDILDLAKIEARKVELYPCPIDLPAFLHLVADIINIKATEKNLLFTHEVSPLLPRTVAVDENRLRQVLLNLLSNAVKFTQHGLVSLHVHVINKNDSDALLRFEVQDTGVGIDKSHLETIFQPFEQAGDVKQRLGGTGLGLAISRELVWLMGSNIHIDSTPGQGSRFWFELRLPIIEATVTAMSDERKVIGYRGPRKKILIVDDIPINRAVVADFLKPLGFEVIEAENGEVALAIAQSHVPDLILMDNLMPVMSGHDVTQRLRNLPTFKEVPIIAISASAFDTDRQNYLAIGVDAFLVKPINFDILLRHIATLLQLNWIYESSGQSEIADADNTREFPLVPPPMEEIKILHAFAMRGSMRDIRQRTYYLETLDEHYIPFAEKLRVLALECQSQAILELVEKYMEGEKE
ncbi:MAG: ATP-binding protein [Pseudomonadota bacterium]